MDMTYVYGRADGRGFPRILVMDDWERDNSLRGGAADERGWTYALMTGGWDWHHPGGPPGVPPSSLLRESSGSSTTE